MRLQLKNFKCWKDVTFDFGDSGLVLLTGISGAGKTSLLTAVYYALFGVGNKLVMFGENSCKVILEIDEMKVTRTKKPNHLILEYKNKTYEDDPAQNIIYDKFGKAFEITSYIQQDISASFILLGPMEKLDLLEKIAFQHSNIKEIKQRLKLLSKLRNDELIKIQTQLETATEMLNHLQKPTPVIFPLSKNSDVAIRNEHTQHKNCKIRINKYNQHLSNLNSQLSDLRVLNTSKQLKSEEIQVLSLKIQKLTDSLSSLLYEGDSQVKQYEKRLKTLINKRKLLILQEQYKKDTEQYNVLFKEEQDRKDQAIKEIDDILWKEHTRKDCEETIENLRQCLTDISRLNSLQQKIKNYLIDEDKFNSSQKELEQINNSLSEIHILLEKLKEIYTCPKCQSKLHISNRMLVVVDSNIPSSNSNETEMQETVQKQKKRRDELIIIYKNDTQKKATFDLIQSQIKEINEQYETIPEKKEIESDLDYMTKYYQKHLHLEQNKIVLKASDLSETLQALKRSLKTQDKEIEQLLTETFTDKIETYTEDQLREIITQQKQIKNQISRVEQEKNETELSKQKHITYLDNLEQTYKTKYTKDLSESKLIKCLSGLEKKIKQEQEQMETHSKNLQMISDYEKYVQDLKEYNDWEKTHTTLFREEEIIRKKLSASLILKQKILKAESISITNVINSINTYAQTYLDLFFEENPISVKLLPFKESKKEDKPQVNLSIFYKNNETDLKSLSGGERQRVSLAFTLALGEMFNTSILLLDECTSNLDQELTSHIVQAIKENFEGRLVVVVGHQLVEGGFDKVIKI